MVYIHSVLSWETLPLIPRIWFPHTGKNPPSSKILRPTKATCLQDIPSNALVTQNDIRETCHFYCFSGHIHKVEPIYHSVNGTKTQRQYRSLSLGQNTVSVSVIPWCPSLPWDGSQVVPVTGLPFLQSLYFWSFSYFRQKQFWVKISDCGLVTLSL